MDKSSKELVAVSDVSQKVTIANHLDRYFKSI